MRKMLPYTLYATVAAIALPLLLLLSIGLAVWGFQLREEKNTVLIKAENQYQRSFFELNEEVEDLHHELAKLQLVKAESSQRKALANVWRIANVAQTEISQLPLTLLPFHETQQLLDNISRFAYKASIRDMKSEPLTKSERNLLQRLYTRTGEISGELRKVQTAVMSKRLRWMDVELALAEENSTRDQSIIDGFKLVNKKVTQYDDLEWGPSTTDANGSQWSDGASGAKGKLLPDTQLKARAVRIVDGTVLKTVTSKAAEQRGIRQFLLRQRATGEQVTLQMDARSGEPVWFLHARPIGKAKLDERQALKRATRFLARQKMLGLEFVSYDAYERTASLTFVESRHKTLIYPHKIVVKVALDNGEVIGVQSDLANGALASKSLDKLIKSGKRLKEKQALTMLGPDFKVQSTRTAIVLDDGKKPVLCYQFQGRFDHHVFRLFLDSQDGSEVQSEMLENVEI